MKASLNGPLVGAGGDTARQPTASPAARPAPRAHPAAAEKHRQEVAEAIADNLRNPAPRRRVGRRRARVPPPVHSLSTDLSAGRRSRRRPRRAWPFHANEDRLSAFPQLLR
jgi:hypothetical protein